MRTWKRKLTLPLKGILHFFKMGQCRLAKVPGCLELLVYHVGFRGKRGGWNVHVKYNQIIHNFYIKGKRQSTVIPEESAGAGLFKKQ